jgi:tape measure domain-containing protein
MQAAKFVFAKTSELETQTKSLEVLTGSVEKATKIIAELTQLGAVTPFTSTELIDAAKRLQAFGVEGDKVVETTRRLADVSGATGAELQGLVTAYGQVQAKGRLQGEELLQFQERGIGLQQELRKMYGMTGDELQ